MFGKFKLASVLAVALSAPAFAGSAPGVTATEIEIGGVFPFSGPASSLGLVGKGVLGYVQSINDRGGINGRKLNYIVYDDGYSPPKAVEHVRKLVESEFPTVTLPVTESVPLPPIREKHHAVPTAKSSPSIFLMQSTQDRTAENAPRCLGGT